MTDVEYRDFHAYREHMSKQFRVYGTVFVTHAGLRASLERAEPQGINPDDLLLKLILQPDFEARSEQPVALSEGWEGGEPPTYDTVSFRVQIPEGLGELQPPGAISVTDVY